jgi:hypothetical protein
MKLRPSVLAAAGLLAAVVPASGNTILIDFETNPALGGGQPSTFAASGPAQAIPLAGIATIKGGVVLSNPTAVPSFAGHASGSNVYGTSYFASPFYSRSIEIDFASSVTATSIQGLILNGATSADSFTVAAYSGSTLVAQQVYSNVASNGSKNGYVNFSLTAGGFTKVLFTPASMTLYDYFLDNLLITYTQAAPGPTPDQNQAVPEPSTLVHASAAALVGLVATWRRLGRSRDRRCPR